MKTCILLTLLLAPSLFAGEQTIPERNALSGGATTVFTTSQNAFGRSAANLPIRELPKFAMGNRIFNTNWVTAPASVKSLDGLGPLFNRVSCSGCHVRDGRGRPPATPEDPMMSMLIRLSVPTKEGGDAPHPVYGGQLQDRAVQGVPAEGQVSVSYTPKPFSFPDGSTVELQDPKYTFKNLGYGELGEFRYSPRVANAVYGLGLLEAVTDETVLGFADPADKNADGISGRINYVEDPATGKKKRGWLGWKCNTGDITDQAVGAANGDMGITTSHIRSHHTTTHQQEALAQAYDDEADMSDDQLDALVFYLASLAVPARRDLDDPVVQSGERLFGEIGCASCHIPEMTTGTHEKFPHVSNQTIQPFTDLLLHDMGPGLADNRPDHQATGSEWRTPPLWGIGLVPVVNKHSRLLHDGRARNLEEAILWHDGEAGLARDRYAELTAEERAAVIRFLESL